MSLFGFNDNCGFEFETVIRSLSRTPQAVRLNGLIKTTKPNVPLSYFSKWLLLKDHGRLNKSMEQNITPALWQSAPLFESVYSSKKIIV